MQNLMKIQSKRCENHCVLPVFSFVEVPIPVSSEISYKKEEKQPVSAQHSSSRRIRGIILGAEGMGTSAKRVLSLSCHHFMAFIIM